MCLSRSRPWGAAPSAPGPLLPADEEKARQDPCYYLKNTNAETRETLQELYKEFKGDEVLAATMKVPEKKKVDKLNAVSGPPWVTGGGSRDTQTAVPQSRSLECLLIRPAP